MSEAEAFNNGPVLNPLGWLQQQINALQSGITGGQFVAIPTGTGTNLQLGMAAGLEDVNGASTHVASQAGINHLPAASPLGIVVPTADGSSFRIQTSGIVELTIDEWDARIEGSSTTGLSPGAFYYVGATAGNITTGVPLPSETSVSTTSSSPVGARIGYALSATELLIQLGGAPNTINLPAGVGAALGMPVAIDEPSSTVVLTPSQANTAPAAIVNAIAGYIDTNSNVIGFTNGMILELTVAQWDARIGGSTGLTPGGVVYLSATAAGGLATAAPATTGTYATVVGVALSTTKLYIQIGTPIGPHA